jgi:acyl dehydratase
MAGINFDDVELGQDLPDSKPDVSMERILQFTRASGMASTRFTDHEGARKEGLPGAIVPGIMSQGILAGLIHRWAPGSKILTIDTVFRAPVLVDSDPTCKSVVTDVNEEDRTVEVDLTILNEQGETRVMGTATVQL